MASSARKRKHDDKDSVSSQAQVRKYGQVDCQEILTSGHNRGSKCGNRAQFRLRNRYLCGAHSKKDKLKREKLTKMTREEQHDQYQAEVDRVFAQIRYAASLDASSASSSSSSSSSVRKRPILFRMTRPYMKVIMGQGDGALPVFPTERKQWQGLGLILPGLSPTTLGPIVHGQPHLPPATCLENFYQFSLYYRHRETREQFEANRLRGFRDTTPHRSKFDDAATVSSSSSSSLSSHDGKQQQANIPDTVVSFVWMDVSKDPAVEHQLGIIESRQFYCTFYERLVSVHADYKRLQDEYTKGAQLYICGPHAYPMKDVDATYMDPKRGFGHERILYTMLALPPEQWPWRKYKSFVF